MPRPTSTSLIDRVDQRDRPIGVIERGRALEEGANFRTVHIFVFNHADQLLIQQLSSSRERHPLRWGSSVAGYLHAGESYEEGARRRLAEEVGLATPLHRIGILPMDDERSRKFVGLFTTLADDPIIAEPDHIAQLQFRDFGSVRIEIVEHPEVFTPTLRNLVDFYVTSSRDA